MPPQQRQFLSSILQPPPSAPATPPRPQGPLTIGEQLLTAALGLVGLNEPQREDFTDEAAFKSAAGPLGSHSFFSHTRQSRSAQLG